MINLLFEHGDGLRGVDASFLLFAGLELGVVVRGQGYSFGSSRCGPPRVELGFGLGFVLGFLRAAARNGHAGVLVQGGPCFGWHLLGFYQVLFLGVFLSALGSFRYTLQYDLTGIGL
jgi:hypothetical protein